MKVDMKMVYAVLAVVILAMSVAIFSKVKNNKGKDEMGRLRLVKINNPGLIADDLNYGYGARGAGPACPPTTGFVDEDSPQVQCVLAVNDRYWKKFNGDNAMEQWCCHNPRIRTPKIKGIEELRNYSK